MRKRIVSGMRPSGKLHLGHLYGALQNWKRLQDDYECFYFVADWHALTTEYADTSNIKENTLEMVVDWIAAGIDLEKNTIFVQSSVPEHAELNLLLAMMTPISWLERVPSYKEQREALSSKDLSTLGFLNYPLLQTADVLIYKANFVPVGIDQAPHIEFAREVARKFHFIYGNVFPEPQVLLTETAKLPGLDGRKMSKSYNNCIYLADPPEVITEKVRRMFTDPTRIRRTDPGHPDTCPVYFYHKLVSPREFLPQLHNECVTAKIGCTDCKRILAEHLVQVLTPHYRKRRELLANREKIREALALGAEYARSEAKKTMRQVRKAMKI